MARFSLSTPTTAGKRRPTKTIGGRAFGFAYNVGDKTVIRGSLRHLLFAFGHAGRRAHRHGGHDRLPHGQFDGRQSGRADADRLPRQSVSERFQPADREHRLALLTNLGLGIGEGVIPDPASPYIQQWNFNVQRELPGNIVFEAAYIGSKGTRLLQGESGLTQSQLPASFLSLGTKLQNQVPNPFFGIITNPSSGLALCRQSRVAQLSRPYPQYNGINAFRVPYGFSIYHGGTLKADKRFSNGMSFLVAYTWSKLIDDVSTTVGFLGQASARQDAYNRAAERAIGSQDIAHRFVAALSTTCLSAEARRFGRDWRPVHELDSRRLAIQRHHPRSRAALPIIITQGANNVGLFNPSQRPNWNGRDPNLEGSKADKLASGSTRQPSRLRQRLLLEMRRV